MIYDYFLAESARYANWFSTNHSMPYKEVQQLFWEDIKNGIYFRICSHFYVRSPKHYFDATRQFFGNPDAYLSIVDPYLQQFEQLKSENPELFI